MGLQVPLTPKEGRRGGGREVSGSSGDGEASSRLSIWLQGAGTEAKRGPSVASISASSLEQAGLGRGVRGTAVWPRSSQAKMGMGAISGEYEVRVLCFVFFRFLIFFHFLNKHEYIYIYIFFFFYKTFVELGVGWER